MSDIVTTTIVNALSGKAKAKAPKPQPKRVQLERIDGLGNWVRLSRTHSTTMAAWLMEQAPDTVRIAR
jgi:hypothetical protein